MTVASIQQATPPASSNSAVQTSTPIYLQTAAVGYIALLLAMVNNAQDVQNYVAQGLMPLSEMISNMTQAYSNAWILVMNNPNDQTILGTDGYLQNGGLDTSGALYQSLSDMGKMTYDAKWNNDSATIGKDSEDFNAHNMQYNQATTFFGGISNGMNNNISNTTNQVSVDYQMIQMNSLAIQQTLVQVAQ